MLAVLAPLLFVLSGSRGVLVRAQLPPESESVLVLREYFSTPLGPQESCVDACESIGGFCNPERIAELALDVQQCHDAVIGHMEWVNSGDPQGRYALFPTGSGQNDNATGNLRDLRLKSSLFYLSRYSLTCVMTPCMCYRRMCSSYQL
jgi:hypothetical protein